MLNRERETNEEDRAHSKRYEAEEDQAGGEENENGKKTEQLWVREDISWILFRRVGIRRCTLTAGRHGQWRQRR